MHSKSLVHLLLTLLTTGCSGMRTIQRQKIPINGRRVKTRTPMVSSHEDGDCDDANPNIARGPQKSATVWMTTAAVLLMKG